MRGGTVKFMLNKVLSIINKNLLKKLGLLMLAGISLQANAQDVVFQTMFFGDYGMSNAYIKVDVERSILVDREGGITSQFKLCNDPRLYCFSSDVINIAIPKGNEKSWFFNQYDFNFGEPFYKYSSQGKELIRVIERSGNDEPNYYYFLNSKDEIIGFAERDTYQDTNKYIFAVTSKNFLDLKKLSDLSQKQVN